MEKMEKTVYVEVESEDDPYLISKDSDYIRYDSTSPTVPTNLLATEQVNGSIKLTWTASIDSGSGLDSYKIYYLSWFRFFAWNKLSNCCCCFWFNGT